MAAKPVKISILADTKDLQAGMGRAENAMNDAADTARGAGKKIDSAFSGVADSSDHMASASAQAAGGLGDLGGALSLMPGPLGALGAGMEAAAPAIMGVTGAADLLNLATEKFPVLAKAQVVATKAMTLAQKAFNLVARMNPIGLIITAILLLIPLIMLVVKHWDVIKERTAAVWNAIWNVVSSAVSAVWAVITAVFSKIVGAIKGYVSLYVQAFQVGWNLVKAAFDVARNAIHAVIDKIGSVLGGLRDRMGGVFGAIKDKVEDVKEGIRNKFNAVVGFFSGLPAKIREKTSGMWDGIKDAFRAAINWLIDKWNGLSFTIPSVDTHLPGVGKVGGFTLSTPNIPHLANGGITTGPMLAMIGDNPGGREAVIPLDKYDLGGSTTININVVAPVGSSPADIGRELTRYIDAYARAGGRRAA